MDFTKTLGSNPLRILVIAMSAISTLFGVASISRQANWRSELDAWLCEDNMPSPPSFVYSLLHTDWSHWLIAAVGPLLLLGLVFFTGVGRRWILFWVTVWCLELASKVMMWAASARPWGYCGLRRDHVLSALIEDMVLVAFAAGVVLVFLLGSWLWRTVYGNDNR